MKFPWIEHPRTKKPDTMLTLAVFATFTALTKFSLNGVAFTAFGHLFNCGFTDAGLIGAILTPTLGAYVIRKHTDAKAGGSTNESH